MASLRRWAASGAAGGGEETDLSIRVRWADEGTVWLAPSAQVSHYVPAARGTIGHFVRRCFAEGRSKAVLAERVGTMDATEAERSYLGTLAQGGRQRMSQAIEQRSMRPLVQIGALFLGLAITGAGFAAGLVRTRAARMLRSGLARVR